MFYFVFVLPTIMGMFSASESLKRAPFFTRLLLALSAVAAVPLSIVKSSVSMTKQNTVAWDLVHDDWLFKLGVPYQAPRMIIYWMLFFFAAPLMGALVVLLFEPDVATRQADARKLLRSYTRTAAVTILVATAIYANRVLIGYGY